MTFLNRDFKLPASPLIGISGPARAGKDAVALRLVSKWGYERLAFADELRREVKERMPRTLRAIHDLQCNPWTAETRDHVDRCIDHMLTVTKPRGIRELLQEYGTDVRRADQETYWTSRWWAAARGRAVVAPDVRFPTEAAAVREAGGVLWRVERPSLGPGLDHVSEHAMDGWGRWDAVIVNEGTIEDLWRKVDELASDLQRVGGVDNMVAGK